MNLLAKAEASLMLFKPLEPVNLKDYGTAMTAYINLVYSENPAPGELLLRKELAMSKLTKELNRDSTEKLVLEIAKRLIDQGVDFPGKSVIGSGSMKAVLSADQFNNSMLPVSNALTSYRRAANDRAGHNLVMQTTTSMFKGVPENSYAPPNQLDRPSMKINLIRLVEWQLK